MTIFVDIETTGLSPYHSKLVTAQLKDGRDVHVWKEWEIGEPSAIMQFLEYLRGKPRSIEVVGYNILSFDLPFIVARLVAANQMGEEIHQVLHDRRWLDLYHLLGGAWRSMDYWLAKHGIERTCHYTGKDIPSLYDQRRYSDIVAHAEEDRVLCERLFVGAYARRLRDVQECV